MVHSKISGTNGYQFQELDGGKEDKDAGLERKRPRKRKTGNENPGNLTYYVDQERDILATAKTRMKIFLITEDIFPDLEGTIRFAMQSYQEAVDVASNLPEESPLRTVHFSLSLRSVLTYHGRMHGVVQ